METKYKYTYAAWSEAFAIFAKYDPDGFGWVQGEHDIVYAGPDHKTVSAEDIARLEELDWYINHDGDGFYNHT